MRWYEYIKQERTKKGISIADLARKTGISRGYLNKLENGKGTNEPSPFMLEDIAHELGISYIDLMFSVGYLDGFKMKEYELLRENEMLRNKINSIRNIVEHS